MAEPTTLTASTSRLRSGFTWRAALGLLYTLAVFQPAAIYMTLATGNVGASVFVQWAVLILFAELARLMGKPLTQQEASLIFLGSWLASMYLIILGYGGSGGTTTPMGLLYPVYLRNSETAAAEGIQGIIPSFYAPTSPSVWIQRNLLNSEFALPMLVVLGWYALVYVADLCLGLFTRQLYIEVEKLPFPTQVPVAEACKTLIEREKNRFLIFSATAMIGMIYGILLYGIPFIWQITLGFEYRPLPIPWSDYNRLIHIAAPGASLGIATDIIFLANGLIIPAAIVASIFAGSFILQFVGNHILYRLQLSLFATEFVFGMSVMDSYTRSMLYAWASLLIGVALAVGIAPIVRRPSLLIKAFKVSSRTEAEKEGSVYYPLWKVFTPFIASTVGISLFAYWLTPSVNLLFLVLVNTLMSFVISMVIGRSVGTAVPLNVPYPRELTFMATGVTGQAWFTPTYIGYQSDWVSGFKIADLTDLHPWSYVKATSLFVPLGMLFAVVYLAHFWSIASIPSALYPGIEVTWKTTAIFQALFIKRSPEVFRPIWLAGAAVVTVAAYLVFDFLRLSGLILGVAAGLATPIPMAFTMLIGAIIAKVLEMRFGKSRWNDYRGVVAAGFIMGEGVTTVFFVCILLLAKSVWFLPF